MLSWQTHPGLQLCSWCICTGEPCRFLPKPRVPFLPHHNGPHQTSRPPPPQKHRRETGKKLYLNVVGVLGCSRSTFHQIILQRHLPVNPAPPLSSSSSIINFLGRTGMLPQNKSLPNGFETEGFTITRHPHPNLQLQLKSAQESTPNSCGDKGLAAFSPGWDKRFFFMIII